MYFFFIYLIHYYYYYHEYSFVGSNGSILIANGIACGDVNIHKHLMSSDGFSVFTCKWSL
jgi:hypothetical protein